MKFQISEPYLWLPVDHSAEKVCIHLYLGEKKIDEITIRLGVEHCDYYAVKDLTEHLGKELQIIRYDEGPLETIFLYHEKPQTVYPFRPKLHFHVSSGWNNDPCGLIYLNGTYHMYYQKNPYGAEWENMQWGHAVSNDLFHWEHYPDVLFPDETGTVYTGSAILDQKNLLGHGRDTILYYYTAAGGKNEWSRAAGNKFTQHVAYSLDGGYTLQKKDMPIMEHIVYLNRDPMVFYHEESDGYILLLYLDKSEFGIYRSEDLVHWTETQRLDFPGMWECPNLLHLCVEGREQEKKWVFWSVEGFYAVGEFDGYRFQAETAVQRGYTGALLHAAQTFANVKERTIMTAWIMTENRRGNYRSLMSVPCELTLKKRKGRYCVVHRPVKELEALLGDAHHLSKDSMTAKLSFEKKATVLRFRWENPEYGQTRILIQKKVFLMDLQKGYFAVKGKDSGIVFAEKTLQRRKFFELMLLVDQEVVEFFCDDGTVYGAVEMEENVLGGGMELDSEIPVTSITWKYFREC